ncbi:MAG: hypothetical protein P1U64_06730 [Alcanivoracaceae bacterium]|nr:hypothetical protein [Alcanivoracaceae bacterium]
MLLALAPAAPAGLSPLDEQEMATVTGAGLNFVWEDFRFLAQPTSYFEQVGSQAAPGSTFARGDLRWYGVAISALGSGYSWADSSGTMTGCASQGINGLGCPRGETIGHFAAHDNPYTLRVQDYAGDGSAAASIGNGIVTWGGDTDPLTSAQTVLELLAPTSQEPYRFAFWGEIEVGKDPLAGTNSALLKSQTLIQGSAAGSELRLFQFSEPGNNSLAIQYLSRLQGDFRFSVNQQGATASDTLGQPVAFEANEGLHFRNVDAYIPLGQLYYQALTLDVPRAGDGSYITDGNFVLRLERIPDELAVYTRFYSFSVADSFDAGYTTARQALLNQLPANHNYYRTHGYSRWGDWTPCQGVGCANPPTTPPPQRNSYNSSADGIFFQKCASCDNFNALAYRINRLDVRAGNNQYTTYERYANYGACTPGTSGNARFNCGYGGAYNASGAVVTSATGLTDPMSLVLRPSGSGPATNVTLPVINTDAVNIGDSRIEGLLINHMQFTSYGASY